MRISDEHLNHYADEFVSCGVGGTFEQFIALPAQMRERKLDAAKAATSMERNLPPSQIRGGTLVEPLHHSLRGSDRPVIHRLRRALK